MLGGDDARSRPSRGEDEFWNDEGGLLDPNSMDDDDEDVIIDEDSLECHPLQKRAHDLGLRLMTELDDEREENAETSDGSTPLDRFIRNSMNISGKLAGALGIRGFGGSNNKGYVLAILRRCLNWANEALSALNELRETSAW
jgi:hypothetical protein